MFSKFPYLITFFLSTVALAQGPTTMPIIRYAPSGLIDGQWSHVEEVNISKDFESSVRCIQTDLRETPQNYGGFYRHSCTSYDNNLPAVVFEFTHSTKCPVSRGDLKAVSLGTHKFIIFIEETCGQNPGTVTHTAKIVKSNGEIDTLSNTSLFRDGNWILSDNQRFVVVNKENLTSVYDIQNKNWAVRDIQLDASAALFISNDGLLSSRKVIGSGIQIEKLFQIGTGTLSGDAHFIPHSVYDVSEDGEVIAYIVQDQLHVYNTSTRQTTTHLLTEGGTLVKFYTDRDLVIFKHLESKGQLSSRYAELKVADDSPLTWKDIPEKLTHTDNGTQYISAKDLQFAKNSWQVLKELNGRINETTKLYGISLYDRGLDKSFDIVTDHFLNDGSPVPGRRTYHFKAAYRTLITIDQTLCSVWH